jgi:hypothetical protein
MERMRVTFLTSLCIMEESWEFDMIGIALGGMRNGFWVRFDTGTVLIMV